VSSAKKNDIRFVQLGKSFMYKGNSIGPSKFPCIVKMSKIEAQKHDPRCPLPVSCL
jgi:hypothetical protein